MLVFVHGLSASSRWFRDLLPLLGGRDVRLLDLPRFGRRFAPRQTVDWLAAELEGDAPVDLVGHSLGGLACARLATSRPELVRRLVLAAPVGAPRPPARTGLLLARYGTALARTAIEAPFSLLRAMIGDAVRWGPEAIARGGLYVAAEEFAGEIAAPTLLVWGERDLLVPVAQAAAWRALVPSASVAVIPGAGHAPMIEAPSAFAQALLEFLDDPGDGGGVRPVRGVPGARDDDEAAVRGE